MDGVTYRGAGVTRQPSPSLWSDCPITELMIGTEPGTFFHNDFMGGPVAAAATAVNAFGNISFSGDTDTVLSFKASEMGGYLDIETDGDANDGACLFTEPFAMIVPNSGNKVWLEARLEIGDAEGNQGFFFGLAEESAQSHDVVADGCNNLKEDTLVGYRIFTGENAIDAVAQKDDSAELIIASAVTNLDVLGTSKAALTDDTEIKLGLRFDGRQTIEFYVNGVRIGTATYSSTYFDKTKALLAIVALKVGTTAAESFAIDWIRGAYHASNS
jgi:hypothetical protein